jgi:Rnl2 family RNA ligase
MEDEEVVDPADADFKKYPSLISHLHEKDIQWWLDTYPHLKNLKFIVREKLDGCNISLLIQPDGSMKVGRRTAWLKEGEKFYDIHGALERERLLVDYFKEQADFNDRPIRVFLELHGKTINKRVYYGDTLDLTVLDVIVGDEWITQEKLYDIAFFKDNPKYFHKTMLGVFDGYQRVMEESCDFNSVYAHKPENPSEGLVIRPWDTHVYNGRGEWFVIKKKAEAFEEKPPKWKPIQQKVLTDLQAKFLDYINENRIISVFSKHGPITSVRQIGDYIKLVMDDAKEDFFKDHPDLDQADRETFREGGNKVVKLLRANMESHGH